MSQTTEAAGGVGPRWVDARQKLNEDLSQIGERLRLMADRYQEKPSIIDEELLKETDRASDIEATITSTYWIMKSYVYAEDGPLRVDDDLWEALQEQKEEFIYFYKSALVAIETYRRVLRTYITLKGDVVQRPQHGDLERIRQDEHTQAKERAECIEAISNLEGKFSATLSVVAMLAKNLAFLGNHSLTVGRLVTTLRAVPHQVRGFVFE